MPTRSLDCDATTNKTSDKSGLEKHPAPTFDHSEYRSTPYNYGAETQVLKLFPSADELLPLTNKRTERSEVPSKTDKTGVTNGYEKPNDSGSIIFTDDIWKVSNNKNTPDNKLLSPDKTNYFEIPNATNGAAPEMQLPVVPPGQHPFGAEDIAKSGSNGVNQTTHGDCVFESTVAALAGTNQGRAIIANMITMGQNGNYIVKFPGDANPTTVTAADVLNQNGINDSTPWARILQAALVKAHPDFAEAKVPPGAGGGTDGNPPTCAQYAAFLLTGRTAEKIEASDDDVAKYIQNALNSDNPVVAFCKDNDSGSLVSSHEWTVTAYNPNDQTVTVRNPWGNWNSKDNDGIEDLGNGQVRMPLLTFKKNFGEVTSLGFPKPQSTFDWVVSELNPFNWVKDIF